MKSAREQFGPPASQVEAKLAQNMKDLQTVRDMGAQLRQAGATQDQSQAHLNLVKNDQQGSHSVQKNMGVQQGQRPPLTPCDGRMQANTQADIKQAGQTLQNAGTTKSASQQFAAPAHTPNPPSQAQGRSR